MNLVHRFTERTGQSLNRASRNAGFAILALMLLCGGTGIVAAWQQSNALGRQSEASALLANHSLADMMHDAIRSDVLAAFQALTPGSELKREDIVADFAEHLKTIKESIAADGEYRGSAEVAEVTSKLVAPMNAYADSAASILDRVWTDPTGASAALPGFFDTFRTLEDSMGGASDVISANAEQTTNNAQTLGMIAVILLGFTLAAGVGGTLMLIRVVRSRVVQPIEALSATMLKLGEGDLTARVTGTERGDELGDMARAMLAFRDQLAAAEAAKDEQTKLIVDSIGTGLESLAEGDLTTSIQAELTGPFARLKTDFNDAIASLRTLIGAVSESAGNLRQGSGEIAQASEDLARRTEANAASLERTAAQIGEMDGRLKATAEAASTTVERANRTISVVGTGRSLAGEAVDSMGRVADSAKGIDDVIEGLDKIAFQTRVLAMNAAVEAGRAGEAGRGFAVVADLVSALAMRAEEESRRARDQLSVTQADIATAVESVRNVDGAFADISENVNEVHDLLGRMAEDNRAQSSAISELNSTIGAMDQSTQQNAAMVEQTSAAARNLTDETATLESKAAQFKVGAALDKPVVRKPAAAAPKLPGAPVRDLPAAAVAALKPQDSGDWATF